MITKFEAEPRSGNPDDVARFDFAISSDAILHGIVLRRNDFGGFRLLPAGKSGDRAYSVVPRIWSAILRVAIERYENETVSQEQVAIPGP